MIFYLVFLCFCWEGTQKFGVGYLKLEMLVRLPRVDDEDVDVIGFQSSERSLRVLAVFRRNLAMCLNEAGLSSRQLTHFPYNKNLHKVFGQLEYVVFTKL